MYFEWADAAGDSVAAHYVIRDHRDQEIDRWSENLDAGAKARLVDMERWARTPGQYSVEVHVRDKNTEKTRRESFMVLSSPESNGAEKATATSGLDEPLRYITRGSEYKRIAAASDTERDSLIAEFWKQRDPSPDTPENELLDEYKRRLDFTIASFGVPGLGRSGWQTDRGRIYLQNGQPSDVQRQAPPGRGGVRYEIWYYKNLDRSFIFRERAGTGEYELVGQQ
jgi:GWxTD domain-containing protein